MSGLLPYSVLEYALVLRSIRSPLYIIEVTRLVVDCMYKYKPGASSWGVPGFCLCGCTFLG